MWQLFDIAYVIPAAVFLGFALGTWLEAEYGVGLKTTSIMIFAGFGFLLTMIKIKRYIDSVNKLSTKSRNLSEKIDSVT